MFVSLALFLVIVLVWFYCAVCYFNLVGGLLIVFADAGVLWVVWFEFSVALCVAFEFWVLGGAGLILLLLGFMFCGLQLTFACVVVCWVGVFGV